MGGLTFAQLSSANASRMKLWHHPETGVWMGSDWSNAMCGEAGEAANVVKKLRRIETGMEGNRGASKEELQAKLGLEIADTITYADLLAQYYDLDTGFFVSLKFNQVSEENGFPQRLPIPDARA